MQSTHKTNPNLTNASYFSLRQPLNLTLAPFLQVLLIFLKVLTLSSLLITPHITKTSLISDLADNPALHLFKVLHKALWVVLIKLKSKIHEARSQETQIHTTPPRRLLVPHTYPREGGSGPRGPPGNTKRQYRLP